MREWDRLAAADSGGGMAELRRWGGARGRVLRTQSVGSAEAEKIPAAAEKSASAAEKVAGEEKRRGQGRFPLESVRDGRGS